MINAPDYVKDMHGNVYYLERSVSVLKEFSTRFPNYFKWAMANEAVIDKRLIRRMLKDEAFAQECVEKLKKFAKDYKGE